MKGLEQRLEDIKSQIHSYYQEDDNTLKYALLQLIDEILNIVSIIDTSDTDPNVEPPRWAAPLFQEIERLKQNNKILCLCVDSCLLILQGKEVPAEAQENLKLLKEITKDLREEHDRSTKE